MPNMTAPILRKLKDTNDDPILKDIQVRQAIAYGTDRSRMVNDLLHGKVPVMNSWLPPDHPDYAGDAAITTYRYDSARARQLLDQAGWAMSGTLRVKDNQPLKLILNATKGDMLREAYLKIFKENMATIGVDVTVELLPRSTWYDQGGKLTHRQFQMGVFPWVAAPDPGGAELWTSTSIPTDTNGFRGQNYFSWRNVDNDAIYAQLGQTLTRSDRHALYVRQQTLVARELPALPLFQHVVIAVVNPKLTGLKLDPTDLATRNIYEWDIPLETP
jgi:peptide/nickel transport system substrate-binding protein